MSRVGAREHTVGKDTFHYKWDNSLPPAVEIQSGDVIHFETEEVTAGQLKNGDPASRLGELDFDRRYPLGGPVYVKDAEPGDALEVEILDLKPGSWGWAAILPGLGLLASDFPEPYVRYFELGSRTSAELRHDIQIPIAPVCGTMDVATDEAGQHQAVPPSLRPRRPFLARRLPRRAGRWGGVRYGNRMSDVVLTPVRSGERRPAAAMELSLPHTSQGPAAPKRCRRLPRGLRPRPGPHGERPQLRPRHHRLAAGRPFPEQGGRLHPVQPGRGPTDQPDRGPAQFRGLVLPAAERLQVGRAPGTVRHTGFPLK